MKIDGNNNIFFDLPFDTEIIEKNFLCFSFFILLFSVNILAQSFELKGTVTDTLGNPLSGVNIVVIGKDIGAASDYEGNYSIKNIVKRFPDQKRNKIPYLLFNLGYRKFGKITSKVRHLGLMN